MPLVKARQVRKKRIKSRTPTRRRGQKKGGRHSHKRKTTQKGVQGREAHSRYTKWKPPTAEQIRAHARIHTRLSVLRDPAKIYEFKQECRTNSGYAKDVLKIWKEDMYEHADEMLRTDVLKNAGDVWGKNAEALAREFLEQRAHFAPKELVAWRRGQIEIGLAAEFLDWARKQQAGWARSQKREPGKTQS